jgi:peptidoglycan/LPS O-acetylase OafA/YrhL
MYVYHQFCFEIVQRLNRSQPNVFTAFIAVIATLVVASASYFGFEKLFLRLKPDISKRQQVLLAPAKLGGDGTVLPVSGLSLALEA